MFQMTLTRRCLFIILILFLCFLFSVLFVLKPPVPSLVAVYYLLTADRDLFYVLVLLGLLFKTWLLMSWCLRVLMSWCLRALMSWCLRVLMSWCLRVLMSWRLWVLMSWCRRVPSIWCLLAPYNMLQRMLKMFTLLCIKVKVKPSKCRARSMTKRVYRIVKRKVLIRRRKKINKSALLCKCAFVLVISSFLSNLFPQCMDLADIIKVLIPLIISYDMITCCINYNKCKNLKGIIRCVLILHFYGIFFPCIKVLIKCNSKVRYKFELLVLENIFIIVDIFILFIGCLELIKMLLLISGNVHPHPGPPKQNFKCEVCQQVFMQKAELIQHMNAVHNFDLTAKTKHKCDICQQSFARKCDLIKHKKIVHKIDLPVEVNVGKHKCDLCEQSFVRK